MATVMVVSISLIATMTTQAAIDNPVDPDVVIQKYQNLIFVGADVVVASVGYPQAKDMLLIDGDLDKTRLIAKKGYRGTGRYASLAPKFKFTQKCPLPASAKATTQASAEDGETGGIAAPVAIECNDKWIVFGTPDGLCEEGIFDYARLFVYDKKSGDSKRVQPLNKCSEIMKAVLRKDDLWIISTTTFGRIDLRTGMLTPIDDHTGKRPLYGIYNTLYHDRKTDTVWAQSNRAICKLVAGRQAQCRYFSASINTDGSLVSSLSKTPPSRRYTWLLYHLANYRHYIRDIPAYVRAWQAMPEQEWRKIRLYLMHQVRPTLPVRSPSLNPYYKK